MGTTYVRVDTLLHIFSVLKNKTGYSNSAVCGQQQDSKKDNKQKKISCLCAFNSTSTHVF